MHDLKVKPVIHTAQEHGCAECRVYGPGCASASDPVGRARSARPELECTGRGPGGQSLKSAGISPVECRAPGSTQSGRRLRVQGNWCGTGCGRPLHRCLVGGVPVVLQTRSGQ